MCRHSHHHSGNESSENTSDLRKILNQLRSFKLNTEVQFAITEEEMKTLRKKDHKYKSKTSSSKKHHFDSEEEKLERDSLRMA